MLTRRTFLSGLLLSPAIVRASSLEYVPRVLLSSVGMVEMPLIHLIVKDGAGEVSFIQYGNFTLKHEDGDTVNRHQLVRTQPPNRETKMRLRAEIVERRWAEDQEKIARAREWDLRS